MPNKIVIAGGTGFIGSYLADYFAAKGSVVVILTRSVHAASKHKQVVWDGRSVGTWATEIEGCTAVINLSGSSILQRWTEENKKSILGSRIDSSAAIGKAIEAAKEPPKVWLNASAVGYYGDTGDRPVDEGSPAGNGFIPEVCVEWEKAVDAFTLTRTVQTKLRIGIPMGNGGMYEVLRKLTKAFFGGAVGSGRQFVPWLHIADLVRAVEFCIESPLPGPVNVCAPEPIRNSDLMRTIRRHFHRPWTPPAPLFGIKAVEAIIGTPSEAVLMSSNVEPGRLLEAGFKFETTSVDQAIAKIESERR